MAFCAIHLLATQYILAQRSKGDVLIFRSRNSRPQAESGSASDIESKPAIETKFAQEINTLQEAGKHNSSSIDTATILTRNILKQSKVFHWNDLCYDVKTKEGTKRILNNVTGWVKPGTLTALMVSLSTASFLFAFFTCDHLSFSPPSFQTVVSNSFLLNPSFLLLLLLFA